MKNIANYISISRIIMSILLTLTTIPKMNYIAVRGTGNPNEENGYELDITDKRYHHEIYLSNPRKCDVSKLKTVIRHPIKKIK